MIGITGDLLKAAKKAVQDAAASAGKAVSDIARAAKKAAGKFSKAVTGAVAKCRQLINDISGEEKYSDGITIKGDKDYRKKVRAQLDELKKTKSGKQIVDKLDAQGRAGKGVVISHAEPGDNSAIPTGDWKNALPKSAKLNPTTGRIDVTTPGDGTTSNVKFNTDYEPKYPDGTSCRSPIVGLGHELIHAINMGAGRLLSDFKDPTDPGVSKTSNHEEAQTIGRGAYVGDSPTDNSLRQELGYKARTSHGSLCP